MGIQNLLPFVAKACRPGRINEFAGCSVAIDVSCLLHRGLFGCMEDLATGKESKAYIYYVKKFIDALIALNCHVIMVFDGRPLPAKKDTNDGRRARREENMRQGEILLSQGRKEEAGNLFRQSTSITREVVENTIDYFRRQSNVDVLVAPYESDAQLAFLNIEGLADVVITEDSDLIAFGCQKIIFKWDVAGPCSIYDRSLLPNCFTGAMNTSFDFTKFRRICIMAGCDYTTGLKGVGLSKALQFFLKTSNSNLREILPRVPSYLRMPKLKVTKEFVDDFIRAEKTFLHQVIYDPRGRCQRPLNPYPEETEGKENGSDVLTIENDDEFISRRGSSQSSSSSSQSSTDFSFAGTVLSASQSTRLALGNSSQGSSSIEDPFHLPSTIPSWSVWSHKYERASQRRERQREEEREERAKKNRMGAFMLDSPERRRKKKVVTVEDMDESIVLIDDNENEKEEEEEDGDEDFAKKKKKKETKKKSTTPAPSKAKSLPARKTKKNEADNSMTTDELMAMYAVDATKKTTTVSGDMEVTVETTKVVVATTTVPQPKKAATVGETTGARKRPLMEALADTTGVEDEKSINNDLPSPIQKECTPPLALDGLDSPLLITETPPPPSSSTSSLSSSGLILRTSTPLTGRSRSALGCGKSSAYFGANRESSLKNPFKKPRLLPPSTPSSPSVEGGSTVGDSPGVLDKGMILTPKGSSLCDSMSKKLDVGGGGATSPYGAIFRSGCRPAGLRRSNTKS